MHSGMGMGNKRWADWFWALGLMLAALLLLGWNLGSLPLRDWDEGIVAQVAREIQRSPLHQLTWLYPTTVGGEPYFNKPPLIHWLVALTFQLGGVNEWTARLPGAILTAISVPLLYWLGRELFGQRTPALFAALVYLTTLPVIRHGRLAMLDGAVLCFLVLMMACLLRSRRDLRWSLGVGLGIGLICLTKSILGLLLGGIALVFLLWDTPRLLTSRYLWIGLFLGTLPVLGWYGAQWIHYHQAFLSTHLLDQTAQRVWTTVGNNGGPPWYYLLELLKYGWPWLLFLPAGLHSAWENRTLSWARLLLLWSGSYLLVVSVMQTKLPWYILPVYPALALLVGRQLAQYWRQMTGIHRTDALPLTRVWLGLFSLLALIGWVGVACFSGLVSFDSEVQRILATFALTLTLVVVLLVRQDGQFIPVLFWGTYLTLLLFVGSSHWNWELAETYPVKPVAALISQRTPVGKVVYTSFPYYRPSLDFYSDRRVVPLTPEQLSQQWLTQPPGIFLVDTAVLRTLPSEHIELLGSAGNWNLVQPNPHPLSRPPVSASQFSQSKTPSG